MNRGRLIKLLALLFSLAIITAACGSDDSPDVAAGGDDTTEQTADDSSNDDAATTDTTKICDADSIVAAVEGGKEEGTLAGMTDDPVGTAASNNPVLTTLVTAVVKAELVDTLNNADALTVFAPTDCAFAKLDPATLEAALNDPKGLLTKVLGFHVIAGERLQAADLETGEVETFTGEMLKINVDGDTVTVGDGQAKVLVPNIKTKNATVHLIDNVMIPPSAG